MKVEVPFEIKVIQYINTRISPTSGVISYSLISEAASFFRVSDQEIKCIIKEKKLGSEKGFISPVANISVLSTTLIDLRGKVRRTTLIRLGIALKYMKEDLSYPQGALIQVAEELRRSGLKELNIGCSRDVVEEDRDLLRKAGVTKKNQIDPVSFEGVGSLSISEKIEVVRARIARDQRKLERLQSGEDVEI